MSGDTNSVWLVAVLCFSIGIVGILVLWVRILKLASDENAWDVFKKYYWTYLLEMVFGSLLVFGLTLALGESGLLSEFFNRQVGDIVVTATTKPEYMRKNMTRERIKEIRIAATEALSTQNIAKGPGSLLQLIEDKIYPMLDQHPREDLDIFLKHEVIELPNGDRALKVYNRTSLKIMIPGDDTIVYTKSMRNRMDRVAGISNDSLLIMEEFVVNGDRVELILERDTTDDSQEVFTHSYMFEAGGKTSIMIASRRIIPFEDHFSQWMLAPTKGLKLTYLHPSNFKPLIYVFGYGQDPQLIDTDSVRHVWEYDGWMMEKQGFLLYWMVD